MKDLSKGPERGAIAAEAPEAVKEKLRRAGCVPRLIRGRRHLRQAPRRDNH